MGAMLTANANAAAEVLHRTADEGSVIAAIAATRSLSLIVEDTLQALVAQARAEGHTWAEVGAVLRVTRQAAFQRFAPTTGVDTPTEDNKVLDDAGPRAAMLVENLLAGHWETVEKDLTARMATILPRELLEATRTRLARQWGPLVATGSATITAREGLTVVDLPLSFERHDATCHVVFTSDGHVAGMLWQPIDGNTP